MVAGVDDCGSVGAREHVGRGKRAEGSEHGGLSAQGHLLPLGQGAYTHTRFSYFFYM